MLIADIEQILESWAPRWIAWERDNVGLQVGDRSKTVRKVLVALDITEKIISEAAVRGANLIVSHHPLLFRPPSAISAADPVGKLVLSLAEKKIALYSAHTNLDFTKEGVSFSLARKLGLADVKFLAPLKDLLAKIVVFVPEEHRERVTNAMVKAGAGVIGDYSLCSFRISGTGTFRGSANSSPVIGQPEKLEEATEVRLEMIVPRAQVRETVEAMKRVHPYEEVAYDVYRVENPSANYGAGAIGSLSQPVTLEAFLKRAKRILDAESLRYAGNARTKVRRVAVCGGSGSELIHDAARAGADVFLTADIRYHAYHGIDPRMAVVDAGHWETEHVVLDVVARRLREEAKRLRQRLTVEVTKFSTNPVHSM
ncbi:MAG: Nif3-like dinuclear metal center hexameric protein [Bacteroidota bacterium]